MKKTAWNHTGGPDRGEIVRDGEELQIGHTKEYVKIGVKIRIILLISL